MERLPKAEAHDEALRMNKEIDKHEARVSELKGIKGAEGEKSQEKLKYKAVALSGFDRRPRSEVYEHLKATYGEDRLAKIPDNLDELPEEMKDGNLHSFFGSVSPRVAGKGGVPNVKWEDGSGWYKEEVTLLAAWGPGRRAVLLEE